jgi:hypothetical protein
MRILQITHPYMTGTDVRALQMTMHKNVFGQDFYRFPVDGVFGPITAHRTAASKWWIGYALENVLPSAGQLLMDYLSGRQPLPADMLARREARLHPKPPKPQPQFRARMVHAYDSLLGVKEGSAKQQEIAAFCHIAASEPWCAAGFWYAAKHEAGYNGPAPDNVAYVPTWEVFARAHNLIVPDSQAAPGMGVTFVWDGAKYVGSGDHIGMIREVGPAGHVVDSAPTTEEANAGGPGGDAVRRELRPWSCINLVFDLGRLQK